MAVGVYVKVPEPLADSLAGDGFRVSGAERGIELYTETLAATANLVTILVGRHEITRFIAHLWEFTRGRAPNREHELTVIVERDDWCVAIALKHEGPGEDGPPYQVLRGMAALLESLAEANQNRPTAMP